MLPESVFQVWPSLKSRMKPHNASLAGDEVAYSLEDLHLSDVLSGLLDGFSNHYLGRKKVAIVSQWSMNYMSVCLPALLLPVLIARRGVALDMQALFLVSVEGAPRSIWLPRQTVIISESSRSEYYQALLDNHFATLFSSLAQVGRVNERMLWSNLAVIWHNLFHRLCKRPELAAAAEEAQRWWYHARLSSNALNLDRFISLVDSPVPELTQKLPLRSHCCLHYMLHDRDHGQEEVLCESCPRLHRWSIDRKVRYLNEIYDN